MKNTFRLVLTIASIHLMIFVTGQTPQAFNYQAVARNANGSVVANQFISVEISIRDGSQTANIVYQEIDTATTNQFGLFTVAIGRGQIQVGTFTGINWPTGNKYIQVGFDPTGGQNFANMGVSQLLSVPYALYAQTTTPPVTHQIGDLYQGGIIVSVWRDSSGVQHGLIASTADISTSAAWSNVSSTLIGSTAESFRNGSANTTAIIGQAGQTSSAALLCHNYAGGGYNDWHLPANWELGQCFNAVLIVNEVLGDINGFSAGNYWSSTEYDSSTAWLQSFGFGNAVNEPKSTTAVSVRAVRSY